MASRIDHWDLRGAPAAIFITNFAAGVPGLTCISKSNMGAGRLSFYPKVMSSRHHFPKSEYYNIKALWHDYIEILLYWTNYNIEDQDVEQM